MSAVLELVLTTPEHARAAAIDAAVEHMRLENSRSWDTSSATCERLLAWLRQGPRQDCGGAELPDLA